MVAPAVSPGRAASSSGSSPIHGRSGNATLTSTARSRRTVNVSRAISTGTVVAALPWMESSVTRRMRSAGTLE